jgi:hypothetical protein
MPDSPTHGPRLKHHWLFKNGLHHTIRKLIATPSNPAKVALLDNLHLKISPCSSIAMLVPDAFFIVKDFCIVLHAGRLLFS